jgi:hypothetical protein
MKPTTNEAFELWSRLARGERSPELDEWVRQVAAAMVGDIFPAGAFKRSSDRAPAALKAVGYKGKLLPYRDIDALIEQFPLHPPKSLADGASLVIETTVPAKKLARRVRDRRAGRV